MIRTQHLRLLNRAIPLALSAATLFPSVNAAGSEKGASRQKGWMMEGLAYRSLDLPRSETPEQTNRFWMASAGGRWRIRLEWEEYGRTRVCDLGLTPDNRVAEVSGHTVLKRGEGPGVATIQDSAMPLVMTGGTAGYLWMSLASADYLKERQKQKQTTLPCLWDMVPVQTSHTCWWAQAEWRLAGTSHVFPSFISYRNDGTNRTWGSRGLGRRRRSSATDGAAHQA